MWNVCIAVLFILFAGCEDKTLEITDRTVDSPSELQPETPPIESKVFAYTAGQYTNMMSGFELNKETGVLSPTAQGTLNSTQVLPMVSAALFNKKFLLTINYNSNSVSCFSINGSNGELTLVAHTDLGAGTNPSWVATHPTKPIAYVSEAGSGEVAVLDVDPNTGVVTERGAVASGAGTAAVEINADGTVLYSVDQGANQVSVFSVDSAGDITRVGSGVTGAAPNHAKLHPSGDYLYVGNWTGASVTSFSVSGTSLTPVETYSTGAGGVYTLAVSPDGEQLYVSKPYGNELVTLEIDQGDGTLSDVEVEAITGMVSVAFYEEFAFLVSWANAVEQPIQTRSYVEGSGISDTSLSSTEDQRGLYQIVIVEIEQDQ